MRYAEKALKGDQFAGSKIIRMLEDGDPEGIKELKTIYPHTGKAFIVGITGSPGTGKSTLVDRIISELRSRAFTVGVVAIDPSSPFSGGAVLGDRIRMKRHAADEGVFVRSMSTRGHLGGLSRATGETALVLDAMGFQVIIIETVGIGQDEVEVADLAHTTAVVIQPGTGDDIQAMKAGILEIGDIFIVNKADKPGAEDLCQQLNIMLDMRSCREDGWRPPVLKTVAVKNEGITELAVTFLAHHRRLTETGKLAERMMKREIHFFRELVKEMAAEKIFRCIDDDPAYAAMVKKIKGRSLDPYSAAEQILKNLSCSI